MSLDISLTATVETEVLSRNITHNLSAMWREAGIYSELYESEGKLAKDVLPKLKQGLEKLKSNPTYFKQFDAPNGWGTYDIALIWLRELIDGFSRYPDGVIEINR